MIGEDRRANSTGVNRVDADVVAPELKRRGLGQSPHSPLAGHVRGEPERGSKPGARGDIDDRAAARLAHRGNVRLRSLTWPANYLEDSLILCASSFPAAVGFTLPSNRISFADSGRP